MNFGRVANESMAIDINKELSIVPKHLLNLVDEAGIKIHCFDGQITPSWVGVQEKELFEDGRSTDDTSAFLWGNKKSIILFKKDIADCELGFSVVLHEFGHALDFALARKEDKKEEMLSFTDKIIIKGWQNDKGLDLYANSRPDEYFAQGFMAYFQTGIPLHKSWSYRAHTREELKERDPNLHYYIKRLCEK